MKNLNGDLKTGNFKQIYLLYGEEAYLKKQYNERFIKAMLPEGDTMNYAYYEGEKYGYQRGRRSGGDSAVFFRSAD